MGETVNPVLKWYLEDKNLLEMKEGNRNPLKIWEKDVAADYFPPGAHILDVGCGMGREAFNLYDLGFDVAGVDISEKAIRAAKEFAVESKRSIEFLCTNGKDLPFEDNSFDVVIIWNQTLGIIYGEKSQTDFLKECNRVLKSNGILNYSGHDREFLELNYSKFLADKKFYPYEDRGIYWETFTADGLKELAQKSGFTVLDCQRGQIYREGDGTILFCVCRK